MNDWHKIPGPDVKVLQFMARRNIRLAGDQLPHNSGATDDQAYHTELEKLGAQYLKVFETHGLEGVDSMLEMARAQMLQLNPNRAPESRVKGPVEADIVAHNRPGRNPPFD